MKKVFIISLMLGFCLTMGAQLPTGNTTGLHSKAHKVITLGTINDIGTIGVINPNKADTLYSADTLFYKVLINHSSEGYPYISLNTKVANADTTSHDVTSTITFWQSVDGSTNWNQIKQNTQTGTLVFDTTAILHPANGIIFDTTKFDAGASNIVWDTTKFFRGTGIGGRVSPYATKSTFRQGFYAIAAKNKGTALYSATETRTVTEAVYSATVPRTYNNAVVTNGNEYSFWRLNLKFESQYLGIRFIAGTKSGAKLVYSGSVRFNKAN